MKTPRGGISYHIGEFASFPGFLEIQLFEPWMKVLANPHHQVSNFGKLDVEALH